MRKNMFTFEDAYLNVTVQREGGITSQSENLQGQLLSEEKKCQQSRCTDANEGRRCLPWMQINADDFQEEE